MRKKLTNGDREEMKDGKEEEGKLGRDMRERFLPNFPSSFVVT